ncbi:MAG: carboxypeptidase regulatory-like domain-containing protein, partial [Planctomycetes bacterium]|nr:carboxypeptidase regulatory-like domain-containing protein [Planctomycetota bacterium]
EWGSLSGHVVREADGTPLANAQVYLLQGDDPDVADENATAWVSGVPTDANGFYRFTGLEQRKYRVNINAQTIGPWDYSQADVYNVQVMDGLPTDNVDVELVAAGVLSGRVLKLADGSPLANAEVELYQGEDPNIADDDAWDWVTWAQTDANGFYRFGGLEERRYRVHVPGQRVPAGTGTAYLQANLYHVQVFSGSETPDMDLRLRPGVVLYGFVRTTQGDPIPNAELVLEESVWTEAGGSQDWYQTMSDTNGRYEFFVPASPGKFFTVYVRDVWGQAATNYASSWHGEFYQATAPETRIPDYELGLGGAVRGRVVNESGVGIEGVHIEVESSPQGSWNGPWVQTDPNGDFLLRNLMPGTNYIRVSNGWNEVEQDGVKYQVGETRPGPLNIQAGGTIDLEPFTIYQAGMVSGMVTDQAGVPVVGALIELDGKDINGNWADREEVVTDAFGQYTVDYVAPGTYQLFYIKDGFLPAIVRGLSVARGQHVDCDAVLKTAAYGATLRGKITTYDTLRARDSRGVPLPWYWDSDYEDYYPGLGLLAFPMGQPWTDQDFLYPDGRFYGMRNLEDIEDGYGDFFAPDANEIPGRYEPWVLPPGDVALCLHYGGGDDDPNSLWSVYLGAWKRLNLSAGDVRNDVDFTWAVPANPGILRGTVTVPAGYEDFPEDWCMIYAFRLDANGNIANPLPMGDALAAANQARRYEFDTLPAGTYRLHAYAKNLASVLVSSVTVTAGQTTTQNIAFTAGGTVSGQVTDGTNPVAGATVRVVQTGAQDTTDASGNYSLAGLNTGTYTLQASAAAHAPAEATVSVTSGTTTTQNLVISSTAGSIAGTVKTVGAANVNGATVLAYNETDKSQTTTTTVGGAFTLGLLAPGQYILAVNTEQYGVVVYPEGAGRITVAPNQNVTGIAITVGSPVPPEFSVNSSVSGVPAVLSMEFSSDRDLSAAPAVTLVAGTGTLGAVTSNEALNRFEVQYTAGAGDNLVSIRIAETTPLVVGNPGGRTFSFEVGVNLVMTNTTNVTNAIGGTASMMGTQDNTQVYVPPFAIAGVESSQAVPLTIERYGDPGDAVAGAPGQTATAVYDFTFDAGGAAVDLNHTLTVTMSFALPAGMTQAEFESTLSVRYFDADKQQWKTDGISNVRINWVNQTITFEVSHLSKFAAFVETAPGGSYHPADGDDDSVIGDFELLDYIDQWVGGQVSDFALLDTIDLWVAGHYYWDENTQSFKPGQQ